MIALGTALLCACITQGDSMNKVAVRQNQFGAALLLAASLPYTNAVFSPASLTHALTGSWLAASGETKSELGNVLGLKRDESDPALLMPLYKDEAAPSDLKGMPDSVFHLASSGWVDNYWPVSEDIKKLAKKDFGFDFFNIDLQNQQAVYAINRWASDNTTGHIDGVVSSIPLGTRVILASALYVKSKWVKPFEKMEKSLPFNSMSGKISARGMTVVNNYRVADDDRYRAVSIPAYGQVSLEVYLPRDKETPIDVVRRLEETQVSFLDETRGVKVVMPYWHIESEHSLVGPLSQLGVKTPFGPLAAFPALGGGIYISEIRQKAYIDVNEKGFEAAAATVVGHSGLGAEPTFKDPQLFIVDRPFYFVVRDEKTRLALFSGFVYEPERIWRFARA